jgi:hypothetical protein
MLLGLAKFLQLLWALPNTMLGLIVGGLGLLTGGRVQRIRYTLEFYGGAVTWLLQRSFLGQSIMAMTLGHVILGVSADALARARRHEWVHVHQYEWWGPFFLPAYAASSLWVWFRGGAPYRDNWFEVQAYAEADCD